MDFSKSYMVRLPPVEPENKILSLGLRAIAMISAINV